jgi:Do/DeqQ family serine protease
MTRLRKPAAVLVSALCFTLAMALFAPVQAETSSVVRELERSFVDIAEKVKPSVVHLASEKYPFREMEEGMGEEDMHRFFGPGIGDLKAVAAGSGVIIDKEGYILTNDHLVGGSEEITVRLAASDGEKGKVYKGKVVGRDKWTDLAVIKIEPDHPLKPAKLGDSTKLKVGQWAIAIGDPWGIETTVTVGIISGLGRSGFRGPLEDVQYQNFIQTDASINQGNSGGPLLNIDGEVIGINTFIHAAAQNIGFAIPIEMAKEIYKELIEHGEVSHGFLGVGIEELDEGTAAAFNVPDLKGALVNRIISNTPAEKAGVLHGDVIRKVDGEDIEDPRNLQFVIGGKRPGNEVSLEVLRRNRDTGKTETKEIKIVLMELTDEVTKSKPPRRKDNLLGLSVGRIPDDLARPDVKGVVITRITPRGPADEGGLAKGDIILEVDMQEVHTIEAFIRIVAGLKPGSYVSFYVRRGDNTLYRALKIPHAKK